MSAACVRLYRVSSGSGARAECSDRRTEWDLQFEEGLKRADERVRAWSRDAGELADEGLEAPTREAIDRARQVIEEMKVAVMDRAAPVGVPLWNFKGVSLGSDGEISFELVSGPWALTYRIEPDGSVMEMVFHQDRLVRRDRVAL